MDSNWIGRRISMDCGPLGFFQGVIQAVHLEEQTITLKEALQNGKPCNVPAVTLSSQDIQEVNFLDAESSSKSSVITSTSKASKLGKSIVKVPKMNPKTASSSSPALMRIPSQPKVTMPAKFSPAIAACFSRTNMPKGQNNRKFRSDERKRYDDDCFGPINEQEMKVDFDFEANLKLFDKKMVLREIEEEVNSNQPDLVRLVDCNVKKNTNKCSKKEDKYKNDENVLQTLPKQLRAIDTGELPPGEYVTEAGLIVPALSYDLRSRLFFAMHRVGIEVTRIGDLVASVTANQTMHLIGGDHRLNPSNRHQTPVALLLCGTAMSGLFTLITARRLASQGVKTVVYIPHAKSYSKELQLELDLYKLTSQSLVRTTSKLETNMVFDVIINGLEDHELWQQERNQPWMRDLKNLIKNNDRMRRVPVIAIDPPCEPDDLMLGKAKVVISPVLPLWYGSNEDLEGSKLVLVNGAVPDNVFGHVGIRYRPPFGAKNHVVLDKVV